jgi:hypothetical protein
MLDLELETQTTTERLATLELLTAKITKILLQEREPIDFTLFLSSTLPYVIDYRNRKHLYLFSAQGIILQCEDIGIVTVPANNFLLFDLPAGLRCALVAPTGKVAVFVRATDELLPEISPSQQVGIAATPSTSNPTATGIGTDVQYTWTQRVSHVTIQNNTAASVFYAFDQSAIAAGNLIYTLATGQIVVWDRQCSILHLSTAAAQNFGGQTGITVEGFV